MQEKTTPRYFFSRAWIYSKEMFPVLVYLPYVIALYVCMNLIVQVLSGDKLVIDTMAIVGMASAFLMMLLMRTFDDLKDYDLDKELFPHRATARKLVLRRDIEAISMTTFLVLLNVNIFAGKATLPVFAIMITYTLLTFKWFFAEQFHRKHIFFTMIDHQPIPYVINFFLIHTALATGSVYESFSSIHVMLWLVISLPVTAWEVSRKIRSADMETEYETFSMVVGLKTAVLIPLICLIATIMLSLPIGQLMSFPVTFYLVSFAMLGYVLFIYLRFFFYPLNKNNVLTNTSLLVTTLMFLNLLVHTLYVIREQLF